jgi:hypothetical protein
MKDDSKNAERNVYSNIKVFESCPKSSSTKNLNKYKRNPDFLKIQCISIRIPHSPFIKGGLRGIFKWLDNH